MAAGGCSAIDVVLHSKGRHDVTNCEVKRTRRREEAPPLFTHINLHLSCKRALKDAAVSRAVDLSAEKYCSVALMLEKAVNILTL